MFDFLELKPILTAILIMGFAEGFSWSVTSACLLGITINEAFSIVVCVLLGLFAFVFGYVAYRSSDDRFMRICAIIGTVLMPIAAVSAILVDDNVISEQHEAVKIPFYMILAIGILVNFTINIIMIVHSFKWFSIKDRLLTNNNQVIYLFLVNLGMGVVLGLVYGLLPVDSIITDKFEDDGSGRTILTKEGGIPAGFEGVDIGPKTAALYKSELMKARLVFWNGPMGVFEQKDFQSGTIAICEAVRELEAPLPERLGLHDVALSRDAAAVHVPQLVDGLAGGCEGGRQRIVAIGLPKVLLARAPVLVDVAEVDDGLVAAVRHGHLVELRRPGVVLLHELSHVVEGAEVVHAGAAVRADAQLVSEDQHLRDMLVVARCLADASGVLGDEAGEGVPTP